ncbi:MAG TPA: DNA-binding domain-containing protein [Burkholderiales bacterium]|nr:DNA-binding domain-containing protein [Burkholderiales bacterium]
MPALGTWQSDFGAALLSRGGPPGMAAYRGNVFGNWGQALVGAYPIVRKIVGEEFFAGLARAYAGAHPSRSGDLNEYGERLADFVAGFPHTLDLPYLPDVARIEWLAHRAYYAPDATPFELQGLDGSSVLRLTPPSALIVSRWPLGRIWTVHQDDYEGPIDVDLGASPDWILVHRPAWRVQVRSLAPGDYRFLEAIQRRETLQAALEAAATEDGAFDASLVLARWVDAGVITR